MPKGGNNLLVLAYLDYERYFSILSIYLLLLKKQIHHFFPNRPYIFLGLPILLGTQFLVLFQHYSTTYIQLLVYQSKHFYMRPNKYGIRYIYRDEKPMKLVL